MPTHEELQASAALIKALRARLGLTLAEMAGRLGVSVGTYKNWEYARRLPSAGTRTALRALEEGKLTRAGPGRPPKKKRGRPKGSKNRPKEDKSDT
jgi:transcriptional regulator with XRE-family HTH domain